MNLSMNSSDLKHIPYKPNGDSSQQFLSKADVPTFTIGLEHENYGHKLYQAKMNLKSKLRDNYCNGSQELQMRTPKSRKVFREMPIQEKEMHQEYFMYTHDQQNKDTSKYIPQYELVSDSAFQVYDYDRVSHFKRTEEIPRSLSPYKNNLYPSENIDQSYITSRYEHNLYEQDRNYISEIPNINDSEQSHINDRHVICDRLVINDRDDRNINKEIHINDRHSINDRLYINDSEQSHINDRHMMYDRPIINERNDRNTNKEKYINDTRPINDRLCINNSTNLVELMTYDRPIINDRNDRNVSKEIHKNDRLRIDDRLSVNASTDLVNQTITDNGIQISYRVPNCDSFGSSDFLGSNDNPETTETTDELDSNQPLLKQLNRYKTKPILLWDGGDCMSWAIDIYRQYAITLEKSIQKLMKVTGKELSKYEERDFINLVDSINGKTLYQEFQESFKVDCLPPKKNGRFRKENELYEMFTNVNIRDSPNHLQESEKGPFGEYSEGQNTDNSILRKIECPKRKNRGRSPKSWEFLLRLLRSSKYNPSVIKWENEAEGTFRLVKKDEIAMLWGQRTKEKGKAKGVTYDSFARILRYHYYTKALHRVSEKHLVYAFSEKVMDAYRQNLEV